MDLVQNARGRPRGQAPTQDRTGNAAGHGPQFTPLHAFAQEKQQAGNDVFGGAWRATGTLRQWQDLVDQPGNQINR